MSLSLSDDAVARLAQQRNLANAPATLTAPPLDWAQAKSVAAARLDENWASPETTKHAASANMAQELAVLLCAFGELAGEAGRHEARTHAAEGFPPVKWYEAFMANSAHR